MAGQRDDRSICGQSEDGRGARVRNGANAYEDGDDLVVDLCPTPYVNMRTYLELDKQLNPPKVSKGISTTADQEFTRYRINTKSGKVVLSQFPNSINSRLITIFRPRHC